jgi:hypothetical protein
VRASFSVYESWGDHVCANAVRPEFHGQAAYHRVSGSLGNRDGAGSGARPAGPTAADGDDLPSLVDHHGGHQRSSRNKDGSQLVGDALPDMRWLLIKQRTRPSAG